MIWGKLWPSGLAAHQFCHSYTEIVVHDQYFSFCNQPAIDKDIDGVTCQFIERNNGAAPKLKYFVEAHLCASQFNSEVHFDFAQQVDGLSLRKCFGGRKIIEIKWSWGSLG